MASQTSTQTSTPIPVPTVDRGERIQIGAWTPIEHSSAYRRSVMLVAAGMVCLPLAYLGLLAGIAWLTWCSVRDPSLGTGTGGGLVHLALAGLGLILFIFLLKPVFAPRGRTESRVIIDAAGDERLHRFVNHICDLVGAPRPRLIEVDSSVNAAARLRRGWLSLFIPGDLALVIGTPLVSGMTVEQFAGVLAHELGHFSQGGAMRSWYLIGTVMNWLGRAAYARDGWDMRLSWLARNHPHPLPRLFWIVIGWCVSCTRWVTSGLYWLARLMGSHMSRQMEFDADRYECRMVGSAVYQTTHARLAALVHASREADVVAYELWRAAKEVPDDIAALTADALLDLTPEVMDRAMRDAESKAADTFSTHPSPRARLEAAKALAEPGILKSSLPATVLFSDFAELSRAATHRHFDEKLGGSEYSLTFLPTGELLARRRERRDRERVLARFMGFRSPARRPLFLSHNDLRIPEEPKKAYLQARAARERVAQLRPQLEAAAAQFRAAADGMSRCSQGLALFQARVRKLPDHLGVGRTSANALDRLYRDHLDAMAQATAVLDEGLDLTARRISRLLGLLCVPAAAKRVTGAQHKADRARELVAALAVLRDVSKAVQEIADRLPILGILVWALFESKRTSSALGRKIGSVADEVAKRIEQVRAGCATCMYPLDGPEATIADRLTSFNERSGELGDLMRGSQRCVERFSQIHGTILAELLEIAESVEGALEQAGRGD